MTLFDLLASRASLARDRLVARPGESKSWGCTGGLKCRRCFRSATGRRRRRPASALAKVRARDSESRQLCKPGEAGKLTGNICKRQAPD